MTTRHAPRALLTIPETAQLLHVSDDTVRRQIREGDLPAVQIGTTPTGRARYRVAAQIIDQRLGRSTVDDPSPLQRLQDAFTQLTEAQRDALLAQAVTWAREQAPDVTSAGRQPQPSAEALTARFPGLVPRPR